MIYFEAYEQTPPDMTRQRIVLPVAVELHARYHGDTVGEAVGSQGVEEMFRRMVAEGMHPVRYWQLVSQVTQEVLAATC